MSNLPPISVKYGRSSPSDPAGASLIYAFVMSNSLNVNSSSKVMLLEIGSPSGPLAMRKPSSVSSFTLTFAPTRSRKRSRTRVGRILQEKALGSDADVTAEGDRIEPAGKRGQRRCRGLLLVGLHLVGLLGIDDLLLFQDVLEVSRRGGAREQTESAQPNQPLLHSTPPLLLVDSIGVDRRAHITKKLLRPHIVIVNVR